MRNFIYTSYLDFISLFNFKITGRLTQNFLINYRKRLKLGIPLFFRLFIQLLLPNNPLNSKNPPKIDLIFACTRSDIEKLSLAIYSALSFSLNEISSIKIICPNHDIDLFRAKFPNYLIFSDEEIIGENLMKFIREHFPPKIRGWVTQQCIKFLMVMNSECGYVLIADSDTVFLKPILWVNENKLQNLSVSIEFHIPYAEHAMKFWNLDSAASAVSFVTHYQLQQRDLIRLMFPEGKESLKRWLRVADNSQISAVSEYHCYGSWVSANFPSRVRWNKWNNRAIPFSNIEVFETPKKTIETLLQKYPKATSLSFHGYLP